MTQIQVEAKKRLQRIYDPNTLHNSYNILGVPITINGILEKATLEGIVQIFPEENLQAIILQQHPQATHYIISHQGALTYDDINKKVIKVNSSPYFSVTAIKLNMLNKDEYLRIKQNPIS